MSTSHDPFEQLRKLAALRQEGIIDDAEFARLKQQLLSQAVAGGILQESATTTGIAPPPLPGNSISTIHRITEADVDKLNKKFLECEEGFSALQAKKVTRSERANKLQRRLRYLNRLAWARRQAKNLSLEPWAPILMATGFGAVIGIILLELISSIPGAMFFGGLSGGLIGLLVSLHLFLIPADSNINREQSAKSTELVNLQTDLARDEPAFVDAGAKLNAARRQHEMLLEDFKSARNHFLSVEWRSLRGRPFEVFLKDVFIHLGYRCRLTANVGDQGVDLIAEKDGVRIAVQAKGYQSSVGNEAVQQACAGMKHYGCNQCVVITNSRFTSAAVALAQSNGCKLIDETQIESLIVGDAGF